MATVKQIQLRLQRSKKKLTRLNKEVAATKGNIKKLESALNKAKAAEKAAKAKKKKPIAAAKVKKPVAKKKTAKKKK
jgi:cell division protein FtsB